MKRLRSQSFGRSIFLSGLFLFFIASAYSQQPVPLKSGTEKAPEIVEMRQADLWSKRSGFSAEILTGNVIFFHEGAFMLPLSAGEFF